MGGDAGRGSILAISAAFQQARGGLGVVPRGSMPLCSRSAAPARRATPGSCRCRPVACRRWWLDLEHALAELHADRDVEACAARSTTAMRAGPRRHLVQAVRPAKAAVGSLTRRIDLQNPRCLRASPGRAALRCRRRNRPAPDHCLRHRLAQEGLGVALWIFCSRRPTAAQARILALAAGAPGRACPCGA